MLKDSEFLREANLMDYSLLLIILNNPLCDEKKNSNPLIQSIFTECNFKRVIFTSKDEKNIFILGIIDYLQNFNLQKFLENKYKGLLHFKDKNKISAVDPVYYAKRFYGFMSNKVLRIVSP